MQVHFDDKTIEKLIPVYLEESKGFYYIGSK